MGWGEGRFLWGSAFLLLFLCGRVETPKVLLECAPNTISALLVGSDWTKVALGWVTTARDEVRCSRFNRECPPRTRPTFRMCAQRAQVMKGIMNHTRSVFQHFWFGGKQGCLSASKPCVLTLPSQISFFLSYLSSSSLICNPNLSLFHHKWVHLHLQSITLPSQMSFLGCPSQWPI